MPTDLITSMKWNTSLKDTSQNLYEYLIWIGLYQLKKLNRKLIIFQYRNHQAQMNSLMNATKHLRNYINCLNLFQKIEAKGILPSSFYEPAIILIPKPKILRWNWRAKFYEQDVKILNKVLVNQMMYKKM